MTITLSEHFPGLYATPELVGRQDILKKFDDILRDTSPGPKLVFLSGRGGIGKTRLLKQALALAREVEGSRVAAEVLDFYHIKLHTPIWMVNAIFESLTPPLDCFQEYQSAFRELNRARLSGNYVELEGLRQGAAGKFDKDLRLLTDSSRVVLGMDTAERLVYGLPGWDDEIPVADAWNWLAERLPGWGNILVFVAGREAARHAINKIKVAHPELVMEIDVSAFGLEDSLEYFEKVAELAREKKDIHLAERLQNLPLDLKRGAHAYSLGRPILLSLLVDYLSFPGEGSLPEMLRQPPPALPDEKDYQRFEGAIFERLKDIDVGETLVALGRVPKGVDEELLSVLLGISRTEAKRRLADVLNLSVVKIRPEDQRVFLHDEIYDLLQRQVYDSPYDLEKQSKAFEAIKDYYRVLKGRNLERLNELYAPVEEFGRDTLDLTALGKAHAERQALLSEAMFYFLRDDLGRGFRAYYRYSHEAILAHDSQSDLQLQAELLAYLSNPPAPILANNISVDFILSSLKIRPVARAWADGKYAAGIETAHNLIHSVQAEWEINYPALLACAHAWSASLHLLRNIPGDTAEAEKYFKKVVTTLKEKAILEPLSNGARLNSLLWYKKAVLSMAFRVEGYSRRQKGFMREAVEEYQKAALLLRDVNLEIEMAITLNDMGFAQAELGEWHDGRTNVTDALGLRRELGSRVPMGLSLNTLASIDVREGRYAQAREQALIALSIFRAFSFTRGIGMSLTTLAEAIRRHAGSNVMLSDENRIQLLREAQGYAQEAFGLFKELNEVPRQVEALIEIGSANRDWVWRLRKSRRAGDDPERLYKMSEGALKQAADLANTHGILYRYVDALVDLLWLKYYTIMPEEKITEDHPLYKALTETEKVFPPDNELEGQPQVWPHKGKLYVLRGHLDCDRFQQQRKQEPKGLSDEMRTTLQKIAMDYARGLDYSSRFSLDYQGMRQAKNGISDRMKELNAAELRVICDQVGSIYPQGSVLQTFLINRALWQTS